MKRVRDLMDALYNGEFIHNDLAFHLLQLQARQSHVRGLMKRYEAADCISRLKVVHPPNENEFPGSELKCLPACLRDLTMGTEYFKVEFFEGGNVKTVASESYASTFPANQYNHRRTIRRVADMILFLDFKMPLIMWIESLRFPGKMISFEGKAWTSMRDGRVLRQRVEMMSLIYDYEHVITVTRVMR